MMEQQINYVYYACFSYFLSVYCNIILGTNKKEKDMLNYILDKIIIFVPKCITMTNSFLNVSVSVDVNRS